LHGDVRADPPLRTRRPRPRVRLRRRERGVRVGCAAARDGGREASALAGAGGMNFLALWLSVGVIGGLASIARFAVHGLFPVDSAAGLPLGTLAVNLTGSLALGVLVGAGVGGDAYLLLGTAALGSYTTFSTWILDSE